MKISEALWKMAFNLCAGRLHKRFVAGDTIQDAVEKAKELKEKGIYSVINILGEHVKNQKEAGKFFYQYSQLITKLKEEKLDGVHVSVKPSQLGLEFSSYLYGRYLIILLKQMKLCLPDSFLEIDREDHKYAKDVREISLALARDFSNQRVACQINLLETIDEIQQFIKAGISVRLCKGTAYPGDIKDEKIIRKIYLEQALLLSQKGNRPAAATHDLYLIDRLDMEQQVLLGIENKKMGELSKKGRKVGFYVPCGPYWRPYGERRGKAIVKIWVRNSFYRVGTFVAEIFKKTGDSPS